MPWMSENTISENMIAENTIRENRHRGRGALSNASGRFEKYAVSDFDDGWSNQDIQVAERTVASIDDTKTILAKNESPDIPFDRSINMYRGCEHGCIYCFARPTHAFLGFSPGLDFETKLFAKPNAAILLRKELQKRTYRPKVIAIGTNTDPYQPIERQFRIMRDVLEVLAEHRHPVAIVTKGAGVVRDIDILSQMARDGLVRVGISVTTLDPTLARKMEPRASAPRKRLEAIKALAEAGVPVGVMAAPMIPSLTDHELEAILEASALSGAQWADYILLRLPLEVATLFQEWLHATVPNRAARVMRMIKETHGGKINDAQWGKRLRGAGVYAQLVARRFRVAVKRNRLATERAPLRTDLFVRDPAGIQQNQLSFDF